jgi:hypothetical protein
LKGYTYVYGNSDPNPTTNKYSLSKKLVVEFLETNEPFKSMFSKKGSARDFYKNVRCGLFHEARTKGQWKILVSNPNEPAPDHAIDVHKKVIYRDKMQAAFDEFVDWFGKRLCKDSDLKKAFVRKFDSLCEE